jgi:hypothetical protein
MFSLGSHAVILRKCGMLERRFLTGDSDAPSAPRLALCNFYGTTALGGAHGAGTVFSF